MTTLAPNLCRGCIRRNVRGDRLEAEGREVKVCDAFPEGIPDAIYFGGADHREPWDGDHGIQFELRPGRENVLWSWAETRGL